jgi:hypothetical protein
VSGRLPTSNHEPVAQAIFIVETAKVKGIIIGDKLQPLFYDLAKFIFCPV